MYIITEYTNIFAFTSFPLRGKKKKRYFYMFLGPLYLNIYSIKHIEMCLEIISWLKFIYTARSCEFKQLWYQMYQADYWLKYFKLVFFQLNSIWTLFNQLILILWLGWSVCMYVCMSRLALFDFISGTILWNLIKLCMNIKS